MLEKGISRSSSGASRLRQQAPHHAWQANRTMQADGFSSTRISGSGFVLTWPAVFVKSRKRER